MEAGVRFGIHVDDVEAMAGLGRLLSRAGNLQPAFEEIGSMLEASAQQRFEDHAGPDGTPWPELSASTKKTRGEGAELLRDTKLLYDSISYMATDDEVAVGSHMVYARIHQLGGKAGRGRKVKIPARPFLGASDDDLAEAANILMDHLGSAFA